MSTIKIDSKVYRLTPEECEALNAETIFQNAVNMGEIPTEGAIELYKMWFAM